MRQGTKQNKQNKLNVVDPKAEVTTEILATSIRDIAASMRKINDGPLNRRAIVVLLRDSTGTAVSMTQIDLVLRCLTDLERRYCK